MFFYNEQNEEISAETQPNGIVTDGLQLHLDAGDPASYPGTGTAWYDLSGNGYNGTLVNGPTYSSDNGGFISFDGVDDYFTTADLTGTAISNPVGNIASFSFFANVLSTSSYYLISTGGQTGDASGIYFSYERGSPNAGVKSTEGGFNLDFSGADFPINEWIGWTVVCDGSVLSLYKNGNLLGIQDVQNFPAPTGDNHTNLTLGKPNSTSNNYYAKMNFSNLLIYNKVLSEAEVLQNFNATKDRFGL